jgi:hypothetical protein
MEDSSNDKPVLLKAVELVLAEPADIKQETESLLKKFAKEHPSKSVTEVSVLENNGQITVRTREARQSMST